MNTNKNNIQNESDIDFYEIIKIIFDNKKYIITVVILSLLSTAILLHTISNKYTSSSLLEPIGASESGLSALGQYSGLASMAGFSLPDQEISKADYAIATIKSKLFFQNLLQHDGILESIYASTGFDEKNKKIVFNNSLFKDGKWIEKEGIFNKSKPSYIQAHKIFIEELLSISKDKETGFIQISITHHSPIFAKDFLDLIISEANRIERQKDLSNADKSLDFLNLEAQKNTFINTEDAITSLMNEKLNIKMLANTTEDYLLELIDPPFYPEKKSSPKRMLLSIAISFVFTVMYIFYLIINFYSLKQIKQKDSVVLDD